MKVILDPISMQVRQERFEYLLRACLGKETLRWLEPHFDLTTHLMGVIAHELGHPWLINANIKPAFGTNKPRFEETKATILGVMALSVAERTGADLGSSLAAYLLGDVLRRFERNAATDPTIRPYYNEGKTIASCLLRAEVLSVRGGKLELDREACQTTEVLIAVLDEPFNRLGRAYQAAFAGRGEEGLAQALAVVDEFAPDPLSPELAALFEAINTNLDRAKA